MASTAPEADSEAPAVDDGPVINPDVTAPVRTENATTKNTSTPHSRTTTTVSTVTTRTPTSTEVVRTTVAVTKDTAPDPEAAEDDATATSPLALPTVTRCTTKEITLTTGKSVVRSIEMHSTTTSATAAELSVSSFDVL